MTSPSPPRPAPPSPPGPAPPTSTTPPSTTVDVLVVGLGVTGAGVALDAASRGLSVLAVDAHDLAFGTSRWSSKLVHGGLRYLAKGQVGVAHESAVERGILMTRTAPHLTRAMPMVVPLTDAVPRHQGALAMQGFRAGDALRAAARTPRSLLPGPRRLSAERTRALVPPVRTTRPARRAAQPRRPARGRRPPRGRARPHRRGVRRARGDARPRPGGHRRRRHDPRRADRRDDLRARPLGGQRRGRVGRAGRRRPHPASQPGHPPRAARRAPRRGSTWPSPPPCRAR